MACFEVDAATAFFLHQPQKPGGAISREKVNFYDFARYSQRLGCTQALYLDGFVSRLYLLTRYWQQTDGDFGVIIGVAGPARSVD